MEEYIHWVISGMLLLVALLAIGIILFIGRFALKDIEYVERKRKDPITKEVITERLRGKEKDRAIFMRNSFFYFAFLFDFFLFAASGWAIWRIIYLWRPVVFWVMALTIFFAGSIGVYGTFPLGFKLYNPDRQLGCFIYVAKGGELAVWLFHYLRDSKGRLELSTNTIGKAIYHVILGKKLVVDTTGIKQNTPKGHIRVNDQILTFDIFLLARLNIKAKADLEEDESEHSVIAVLREHVGLELEMAYIYADSTLDKHWLHQVEKSTEVLTKKIKRLQEEKAELMTEAPDLLIESILGPLADVNIDLARLSKQELSLKMNEHLERSRSVLASTKKEEENAEGST